jgi:8-oxo-dGTP pyrophosphatase MutT (NUDIX family)
MAEWRVNKETIYPAGANGQNPFGNRFYGYRKTYLTLPDGQQARYHGVLVGPCVHVGAVEDDGTIYLVKQRRPNVRAPGSGEPVPTLLELPGGFVGKNRTPEEAGREGLAQEVGRCAAKLDQIGVLYPSVGISDERDHILLGQDLSVVERVADEATEQDLRVVAVPFGQTYDQMRRSEVPVAAQTLAAMSMIAVRL